MSETNIGWHVDDAHLLAYVQRSERSFATASIEAHVLECEQCRISLASLRRTSPESASAQSDTWAGITMRIDRPRRTLSTVVPALQVSLGSMPLVGSTVGAAVALLATLGAIGIVAPRSSLWVQLALAPLAPVVAAALAFQPGLDPAGYIAEATPLAGGRVPYMRALAASLVSLIAGLLVGVFVSMPVDATLAWSLPGLAFATCVIAAGTWVDPARVAAALSLGWALLVAGWWNRWRGIPARQAIGHLVLHQRGTQVACLIVATLAVAVSYERRHALPNWRTR